MLSPRRLRPALLAIFVIVFAAARAAIPFPQEGSDLKPDPAAHFGVLPNGLRYVIRHNAEPKNRASLRLLVEAGAFNERDDQNGLAHFLEHMAFNGSTHYAPGTLVKFFQRMGMNFGGDTNANTTVDRTLYQLELPDTNEATLAEGLRVFSDYAGGLLLKPEEIDKERGIILSEKRTADSVGYRIGHATRDFLFAGTLLEKRDVLGQTAVLENAQRDRFLDLYDTWYRPEAMAVIVVGDVDPATVEKQIAAAFAPLAPRAPARPAPDRGAIPAAQGLREFYYHEDEAPSTTVMIATVIPHAREPDTKARQLRELPRQLASAMINRRLSVLAKKENAPFLGGGTGTSDAYNLLRETSIGLSCKADQWSAALGVADQELRRALAHGFQNGELREVVAGEINSLEQAVKTAPTRHSNAIAEEIAQSLLDREVYTSAEDDLALLKPALETITPADCLAALRDVWSPPQRIVLVTGNARIDGDAKAAIAAVYEKAHAAPVAAPAAEADLKWAYTDFGAPGKIAQRAHVGDLDVTLIAFENGVRLNLKKTDFEANRIRLSVRIGTGELTEPKTQPGLSAYAGLTFSAGGLGRHSVDDLRRILAGRTVGAGFSVGGDALSSGGTTNREDLLLELQLIAAHLVDPGYRAEAARQAQKSLEQTYLNFEHTANGPFSLEVARLLASGDHRFGLPPKAEMLQRNPGEVKAWLAPQLARGAIEIAIVGDIDLDATIAAVAQTFGALPARDPKPALEELRQVAFPAEPFAKEYAIPTEIPKAQIRVYWPTTDDRDIKRTRRLSLLANVLSDRLRVKVREELGDAYSPGAGSSPSDTYRNYGFISAGTTVEPAKAKFITDVIVALADDMAKNGITADELERAKKPVLTSLRESVRTNQYWLGSVLAKAQERPEALDWSRTRTADIESITKADLDALAKLYLGAARASRVAVVPAAAAPK
jgi:zinc protease